MSEVEPADCIAGCFDRQVEVAIAQNELPAPSPISLRLLEMLDDVAEVEPTVLDLGCGTAAVTVRIAEMGASRITGVDLSSVSIETAQRRATAAGLDETRARFIVGDAASASLDPHDWVLLDRVICCYRDAERLIDNATSAASTRLAFSVPESRGWRGVINSFTWGLENLWKKILPRTSCPGHVHDVDVVERMLAAAEFQRVNFRRRGLWYAAVFQRRAGAG